MRRLVTALALLAVPGCAQLIGLDDPVAPAGDDAPPPPDGDVDAEPPQVAAGCDQLDLLFVVDSSGSMIEEQQNLALAIPAFVDVITTLPAPDGGHTDVRIGVTTPGRTFTWTQELPGLPPIPSNEVGDDGALHTGCGSDRAWIDATDDDPRALFACRAQVGTDGPATEMPLYAIQLATFDRVVDGTNAGFLRPAAPLVVVVVTDEDDCSRTDDGFTVSATGNVCDEVMPPGDVVTYLDALTGARNRWAMLLISAPADADCSSVFGTAVAAPRLHAVADASPDNVAVASVCTGNLALALDQLLDVVEDTCATP